MDVSSILRKASVIFAAILLLALTISCLPASDSKAKLADTMSSAERKKLEQYARQGDSLADVALDRSIAHVIVALPSTYRTRKDYWFDPRTRDIVIDESGYRNTRSVMFLTHEKDALILKAYQWGGFNPDHILSHIEISNAAIEFAKESYSPTIFMGLFGEGAEAYRKFPSYAYAMSNREFLAHFYDPTNIGGVAADYSHGPKKPAEHAGRAAYKVHIGPSASYKLKLDRGLDEDYAGNSYIDVYFDEKTGLPLKIDRNIHNSRLKYTTEAILDVKKVKMMPTGPMVDERKFDKKHYRRLLLANELQGYDFLTLGDAYKGFACQPVTLSSTDTAGWTASIPYQRGSDGFVIDEVDASRSQRYKEDFINRIKGVSEEKTLMGRSHSGLTGGDVHKDPLPEPKMEKVRVGDNLATLYSYVGLVALEMKAGDKVIFIRDLDEYHDDFSLSRDMLLAIAADLVKS